MYMVRQTIQSRNREYSINTREELKATAIQKEQRSDRTWWWG